MNSIISFQPSFAVIDPNDNNAQKELPNSIETSYLNTLLDGVVIGNTSHLSEDFSLSNYEDDDEDSGFCCPCCLLR